MTHTEKLKVVAKVVFANLPFENKKFTPTDINDCAIRLLKIINKEELSWSWIQSVFNAHQKNQPIYISFSEERVWNFLTMAEGTREDIIREIARIDWNKIQLKKATETH